MIDNDADILAKKELIEKRMNERKNKRVTENKWDIEYLFINKLKSLKVKIQVRLVVVVWLELVKVDVKRRSLNVRSDQSLLINNHEFLTTILVVPCLN